MTGCARGMTLLEVMFALAILAVLSVGVGAFYFEMNTRRDRLVLMATQQRDVSLYFDRLEGALLSALAVAPDGSAGVRGDATSLSVATRAVQPSFEDNAALDDGCVMTFAFDEPGRRCTQSVAAGGQSISEPVLSSVERLRYRYSDGRRWSQSFDSASAGGLPVAVEVSVWLASGQPSTPEGPPAAPGPTEPGGPDGASFEEPEDELGPLDIPTPEPEEAVWTPREPDHVRVIGIPDAPDWQEREG
ncbi:MAG: prepilin-type N-terminal cleavage/methylation domain-containing protein [Phycisphaerales bacterium]|nr:prepilin-type N-terminal cleavage/methylation domain-containing protein [Phycisphaerales bacterium]